MKLISWGILCCQRLAIFSLAAQGEYFVGAGVCKTFLPGLWITKYTPSDLQVSAFKKVVPPPRASSPRANPFLMSARRSSPSDAPPSDDGLQQLSPGPESASCQSQDVQDVQDVRVSGSRGKGKRRRPNTFVSLPITSAAVRARLVGIQEHMLANDASIESLRIPAAKFHLTLLVIHLHLPTQRDEAQQALEEATMAVQPLLSAVNFQFHLDKLSHFGKNVVFMTMSDEAAIATFKEVAERIHAIFANHGLPSTDSREVKPHVTLFKSQGRRSQKIANEVFDEVGDTDCGPETFYTLQLCSMTLPKQQNGYYHIIHENELNPPPAAAGETTGSADKSSGGDN